MTIIKTSKEWQLFTFIPFIIGAIFSGVVIPIFWILEIIPTWSLFFLGIIPLIIGLFITDVFRHLEYKPGEPSRKCHQCGLDVYVSSMEEHLKFCGEYN